jgi:alkylhydroperoxidase family enzyme
MAVEEVAKVITNWREADLDEQEKAMLAFTEKFTLMPGRIADEDVDILREAGFDENQILAIALGAGYRNWVDRIADLLGVEEEKFDFPDEILKAFGVSREQLQTSLYEDDK